VFTRNPRDNHEPSSGIRKTPVKYDAIPIAASRAATGATTRRTVFRRSRATRVRVSSGRSSSFVRRIPANAMGQ